MSDLRILIVAEHASAKFGGEAILPLHYFRLLRKRGVEAWLVVHSRTRGELSELLPHEADRIHYVPDTRFHRLMHALGKRLPARLEWFTSGLLMRLYTQVIARRKARELVRRHHVDVVHQPIPVSPKEVSLLHGLGAPVVIGPMNGGMSYPPGFRRDGLLVRGLTRFGRWVSHLANRLLPGKLRAEMLLVANERTRRALPRGVCGEVRELVENGVDLSLWRPAQREPEHGGPVRFVFSGRLVQLKAVDLLLEAFARVVGHAGATLTVLGDGPERARLESLTQQLGLGNVVSFHGWLTQPEASRCVQNADVLGLPSLHECGGAVVLEAMAAGLPVIATDWGGPADYLDPTCGILVKPSSREALVEGLAGAMRELATSPERRRRLGRAGRERVLREFDWERKIDQILEIYSEVAGQGKHPSRPPLVNSPATK
jgi:glycosyltransferase involved in cell wall biosynthesis